MEDQLWNTRKYLLSDGYQYTGAEIVKELHKRKTQGYRTIIMPTVPDEELERLEAHMSDAREYKKRRRV